MASSPGSVLPPIPSFPFVNISTGLLTPTAVQFLQQLYGAIGGPGAVGTWTPLLQGSVTTGSPSYNAQTGNWRKVNKMTWFFSQISLSSLGGASGNLSISGLPYNTSGAATILVGYSNVALSTAYTEIVGLLADQSSTLNLMQQGTNQSMTPLTDQNMSDNSILLISGTYGT